MNYSILTKINSNCSFKNKIVNQNLYSKFFVRTTFKKNKFLVIDNGTNTFNIPLNLRNKFLLKKKTRVGYSFSTKTSFYKHKLDFDNLFNFEDISKNVYNIKYSVSNAIKFLKDLKEKKTLKTPKKNFLILLNPKKGGFICYSQGVFAFLPKKHIIKNLLNLITEINKGNFGFSFNQAFQNYKKTSIWPKKVYLLNAILNLRKNKKNFSYRIPFIFNLIRPYCFHFKLKKRVKKKNLKKNFLNKRKINKLSERKKKIYFYLSFIFLTYKKKLKKVS